MASRTDLGQIDILAILSLEVAEGSLEVKVCHLQLRKLQLAPCLGVGEVFLQPELGRVSKTPTEEMLLACPSSSKVLLTPSPAHEAVQHVQGDRARSTDRTPGDRARSTDRTFSGGHDGAGAGAEGFPLLPAGPLPVTSPCSEGCCTCTTSTLAELDGFQQSFLGCVNLSPHQEQQPARSDASGCCNLRSHRMSIPPAGQASGRTSSESFSDMPCASSSTDMAAAKLPLSMCSSALMSSSCDLMTRMSRAPSRAASESRSASILRDSQVDRGIKSQAPSPACRRAGGGARPSSPRGRTRPTDPMPGDPPSIMAKGQPVLPPLSASRLLRRVGLTLHSPTPPIARISSPVARSWVRRSTAFRAEPTLA
eukprot:767072-Hanusia_phi.AAC.1